jgi:hypothetical protein
MEQFPVHAETLAKELGFTADCLTNREARFLCGLKQERDIERLIATAREMNLARQRANPWGAELTSTHPEPSGYPGNVELPQKLKAPEIRELMLAEQQRLRALGEAMAEQALGPDWKKPVAKKIAALGHENPYSFNKARAFPLTANRRDRSHGGNVV